jgi:hypothetical protein
MKKQLIFIYAAKSDILSNVPGSIKKMLGGSSSCSLCNITHGAIKEKRTWSEFISTLSPAPIVYHKDEVTKEVQSYLTDNNVQLPVVLEKNENEYKVVFNHEKLNKCDGKEECLIELIKGL